MPKGLKVHNRYGTLIYDSIWIEGVEYSAEDFDDENYKSESDSDPDEDDSDDQYDEIDPEELDDLQQELPNLDKISQDGEENNTDIDEDGEEKEEASDDEEEEADSSSDNDDSVNPNTVTRSGIISKAAEKLNLSHSVESFYQDASECNTQKIEEAKTEEYTSQTARVIANVMCHITNKVEVNEQFTQTFSLNSGIKVLREKGKDAAFKEVKQLHDRVVFEPIRLTDMNPKERKRAMESLIFLVEKRDGTVKARTCANVSTQREYIEREDAASPTASTDSIIITSVIDAKQNRDVMISDVPNACVQTEIDQSGEKVVMKIRGVLVDMLVEMCPEIYQDYVVTHGKEKNLYHVRMLKALYG
eukprot:scaffold34981_cov50-Attheya_sp.AAC.2